MGRRRRQLFAGQQLSSRGTPRRCGRKLVESGVSQERILISADGNGAPPKEERGKGQPHTADYMPLSALRPPTEMEFLLFSYEDAIDNSIS